MANWRMYFPGMLSLMCSVLFLGACSEERPPVVVYVSADQQIADPILKEFTQKTGIEVAALFDTEATKTTGLANRLRREKNRPKADVFWSSEPFVINQLADQGVLKSASTPILDGHPPMWRDGTGRWFGFSGRARVIVYDPEKLALEDRPPTWMDLLNDRYRDRLVMADPRFGTTRGHMGAMKAYWDISAMPGFYEAWLDGLAENGIRMLPGGNAAVVDSVARGESLVGLTDTDDVWSARRRGLSVEAVYARHDLDSVSGGGTLIIPNAVGLVAGSPNEEDALKLLEFLSSAEVEKLLHASPSRNVPIAWPAMVEVEDQYVVNDPLAIPISAASVSMDTAVDQAMNRLDPDRIKSLRERGSGRTIPEGADS